MIINQPSTDWPLCPQSGHIGPQHPAHALMVQTQDAVSAAMKPWDNAEGDSPESEAASMAVYKVDSNLRLYLEQSYDQSNNRIIWAYYFACPVCGFVLPASSESLLAR